MEGVGMEVVGVSVGLVEVVGVEEMGISWVFKGIISTIISNVPLDPPHHRCHCDQLSLLSWLR